MRTGLLLLVAVWLILVFNVTAGQNGREPRRLKRKRDGHGQARVRSGRAKPLRSRHVPHSPRIPAEPVQGNVVLLESYRDQPQRHSSYNVLPGKQGQCVFQGMTMFNQAVWAPTPCITCLCTGGRVVCDELACPATPCRIPLVPAGDGECCPVCTDSDPDLGRELSGDSPAPRNHDNRDSITSTPQLTHQEIQRILWRQEEERLEKEAQLRKREEAKKRKRKEQEERQRRIAEEARRREEEKEGERRKTEERENRRKMVEEESRRKMEEERRRKEEKEAWEREKKLREEILQEEEEEEVWLRGDVFQMLPKEEEPEEPDLLPAPLPRPPAATEDELNEEDEKEEEEEVAAKTGGLPPGCEISDITLTCDNAKLTNFPPLLMPQLKSLSLEGNNISSIPAEAFNGIPNLEWINLKKNKLTSAGIDQRAFQSLKALQRLYLDGNLLEVAPANLPPSLQELKINENRLHRIRGNTFQGLSNLVILELEANLLSEANVDPEAFTSLSHLSYLRLGRNHFRSVPQGLPALLLELYLENNLIEEIPPGVFNNSKNLNVLSLRHNRLEETRIAPLAWIHHRSLESMDLSYNKLYLVPSYLPKSLVHLVLVGNRIERIPGFVFAHMDPGLEYLYLSYNKLDGEAIEPESFFGSYHSMVELCLDHNQLLNVPSGINEMTNLHFLRLNNNKIRSIPDEGICDPDLNGDSTLVAVRLENNLIDPLKVSPSAFSCVRASSSVVLKPQKIK
ncbi:extracellular matrix protein 2 [Syngnathoides biaculeatus]|uniref:extracellular matrix protein 2 n=1 Tax=Syngnathoides biaculeatus TaxID=300417 RepID=UPI002ADD5D8E|nr:extracellular matrix protein 2 [Syngnathoides biaculeatus]XP_061687451.1 extracellular matrix protein 2 [Syngnathoides biaculeatus]